MRCCNNPEIRKENYSKHCYEESLIHNQSKVGQHKGANSYAKYYYTCMVSWNKYREQENSDPQKKESSIPIAMV